MGHVSLLPKCLSDHLRSSLVLSDLPQALDELICNCLDAGAKNILVYVDVGTFYLKVEDDGSGITREDLMLVGERHATSKLHDLQDLENGVATLGFRGEALSSIAEVAVLEIITRVRGSPNTYKKVLKGSLKLSMGICSEQRSPGTTVVVRELFHNLPVRRKNIQSSPRKVLQGVKDHVIRLALVHPDVKFTVIDSERQKYSVQTKPCLSSLDVFCQFFGEQYHSQLVKLHYKTEDLKLDGFISTVEASKSSIKALQFLYINGRYVHKTPIHKLINSSVMDNMGLGNVAEVLMPPSRHSFPEFVLDLKCPLSNYDITFEAAKTYVEFKDWNRIIFFVKSALETVWNKSINGSHAVVKEIDVSKKSLCRKRKTWDRIDPAYCPRLSMDAAKDAGNGKVDQFNSSFDRDELFVSILNQQMCPRSRSQCEDEHCGNSLTSWSLHQCNNGKRGKSCEQYEITDFKPLDIKSGENVFNSDVMVEKPQFKNWDRKLDFQRTCDVDYSDCNMYSHSPDDGLNSTIGHSNMNVLYCVSPFKRESVSSHARDSSVQLDECDSHHRVEELESSSDSEILLHPKEQIGEIIKLHRDKNVLEFLELPSKIRKGFSPYQMGVRRCLYDVALKHCYTDDFFYHSERQRVNNFNITLGAEREWILNSDDAALNDGIRNDIDEVQYNHDDGNNTFNRAHLFNVNVELDNNFEKSMSLTLVGHTLADNAYSGSKDIIDDQNPDRNLIGEPSIKRLQRTLSGPPFYRAPEKCNKRLWLQQSHVQIGLQTIETLNACQGSKCEDGMHNDARQTEMAVCDLSTERDASITQSKDMEDISPIDVDDEFSPCSNRRNFEQSDHHKSNPVNVDMSATQMYKEWKNPCMRGSDLYVLDLSSVIFGPSKKNLLPQSISKEELKTARVLQQIEKKFIAVVADKTLLLIDQHAADERVRLEQLREEVLNGKKHLSSSLDCPLEMSISMVEQQLLQVYQSHLEYWGWHFRIPSKRSVCDGGRSIRALNGDTAVLLTAVPMIFGERLTDASSLSEYLHQLAATDGISVPPPAVLRLMASKACRGAIMFGDFLLRSECQQLVEGLKRTSLAFQCAHGRPTLVPLVNLEALHLLLGSESRMEENKCDSTVDKIGCMTRTTWHGLQWHRPTLQRAMDRLKNADEQSYQ